MEAGPCAGRARRQAAVAALENMRRVREWEDMSENSKRFRECAAQIDAEFKAEVRHKAVSAEDLESDAECESEGDSDDGYVTANDSFVSVGSDDDESVDKEFEPPAAEEAEASDDDDFEECVSETSEVESHPDSPHSDPGSEPDTPPGTQAHTQPDTQPDAAADARTPAAPHEATQ